jgi:hypothetical protein
MSSDFSLHIVMNKLNYNVFIDPYGSLNVSEDDIFKHGQYTDNLIFLNGDEYNVETFDVLNMSFLYIVFNRSAYGLSIDSKGVIHIPYSYLKVVTEDERQRYYVDVLFDGEDRFEYTIFLDANFAASVSIASIPIPSPNQIPMTEESQCACGNFFCFCELGQCV